MAFSPTLLQHIPWLLLSFETPRIPLRELTTLTAFPFSTTSMPFASAWAPSAPRAFRPKLRHSLQDLDIYYGLMWFRDSECRLSEKL